MHILIGLVAAVGSIVFWLYRARMATNAASELAGMAGDVMSAARRFGFRRRSTQHPVTSIEDTGLAAGALTVAFLDLGASATSDQRKTHLRALQSHLDVGLKDAEELLILGNWMVNECNGPSPAVTRLGKRLMKLGGSDALDPALAVINDVARDHGGLTDGQRDALHDLRVIFRR